jgi:transcriptional regulator with XRE-family HTH domain
MSKRLDALARRLETESDFLASALATYADAENLSDEDLATRLGCETSRLAAIRLCRMPRSAPAHFRQDINRIAEAFQIDALVLAEAVRLATTVAAFDSRESNAGYLMAARDRTEEQEAGKDGDE